MDACPDGRSASILKLSTRETLKQNLFSMQSVFWFCIMHCASGAKSQTQGELME